MTTPTTPPPDAIQGINGAEVPPSLTIATAIACGVLAAIATLMVLSRSGIELSGVWQELFSVKTMQLRSAAAWWAMAASALLVGAAVAGALSRLPPPWTRIRLLRWLAGAAIVFALADAGHSAGARQVGGGLGIHVAASFAALTAAAFMALFGAFFAMKR